MTDVVTETDLTSLFPGDGEMAVRCRAVDWGTTPLGDVAEWAPALRIAVRTAMECPFPMNLWCGDDKILIYNDAYAPLHGSKHPRALGRACRDVWPEVWPELESMCAAVDRGERVFAEDGHFVLERMAGIRTDAWFTFSLSPVRRENGEIVAILNLASETTQRVLAERALRDARGDAETAERHLREIFAQAPAFLAVLKGPRHEFEFVNDAYRQLIGHREVLGRTVADALPELDGQGVGALLDRVYLSAERFVGRETSCMIERVAGEPLEQRSLDFVYQPITDASGASSGIVVHGSDVTEAVRARHEIERLLQISEEALARVGESESRYRFLANTIPVQVWTATPDGSLDYVSERTARFFGVTEDSVLGEAWVSMLHPDDVAPTISRWQQSIASGEPYEVEFRLRSSGGNDYRWHLARATAQRDGNGTVLRWYGTNTDIEDRRRAEAALQRLTHEATEANRAKSDFLAAMSHELRTPLNAIGGYAQLIELGLRGPVTDEQRTDLSKIQRSRRHLESLVNDVLNFAKAGSGHIDYRAEPIVVARTIDAVREMVGPQVEEKKLSFDVPDFADDICVLADEDRARQILLNLLGNALKFTPAGGLIRLDVLATEAEVAVSVSDTGIGVPPEMLDVIFEPFVQAERALRSRDQGVGLGLAISRQLARAMGGDLRVQSTLGKGSTFTLTLPRAR